MTKEPVAILRLQGAVGQEFIRLIEERKFPYSKLKLLASYRSAGKKMTVNGEEYTVEEAKLNLSMVSTSACSPAARSVKNWDLKLLNGAASSSTTPARSAWTPTYRSSYRKSIRNIAWHKGIIANPNCSTIIMLMALKPIHDLSPIKRIIVSTYQAVSGAGKEGIDELDAQVREHSEGREMTANILPSASAEKHYPIAFNLIPQIDVFCDNLYTKEEMKMVNKRKKL